MADKKAPRPYLLNFTARQGQEEEEGEVVAGKKFVPADCVRPLKHALATAEAGHTVALALVTLSTDGSELFLIAANHSTFSEILGALEVVKKALVDAALEGYDIKPPGPERAGA